MSHEDHLLPGETVVYRAHPSRIGLVPPLGLAALGIVLGAAGWHFAASLLPLVVGGAVAAVSLVWAAWIFVRLASRRYLLTDRRVILIEGLLAKSSKDAYLDKINNVEHRQTLAGRIFGFGDLEIDTASESGASTFERIADPLAFKRAILESADRVRGARGAPPPSGAERLRELKALLDDGLITEEEFAKKRAVLLDQL
ncbi:MAG TPA: PH domain-containing protein [Thermoanaerobaculia bacterium]|nr:PH domain-containing protein [Thermoanaerobaculia bacterium]